MIDKDHEMPCFEFRVTPGAAQHDGCAGPASGAQAGTQEGIAIVQG